MAEAYVNQLARESGLDVVAASVDESAAYLKSEMNKWGKVIKERGMRAD